MQSDLELVVAATAPDGPTAELFAGILRDAGIAAEVRGGALVDTWAMSQKAMGLLGVEVRVPRARLAEARRILDEAGMFAAEEPELDARPPDESASEPGARASSGFGSETRRLLVLELVAVVLLAFVPGWYGAVADHVWPHEHVSRTFIEFESGMFLVCLSEVAVVLAFVARSSEGMAAFGLTRPRWIADPLIGIAGFSVVAPLLLTLPKLFPSSSPGPHARPEGAIEVALLVLSLGFSAFSEELIARGYLVTRLERLLRSRAASLVVSAALFASWHAYQGPDGVLRTFAFGLVLGGLFVGLRRLWPLVVLHAAWNLVVAYA